MSYVAICVQQRETEKEYIMSHIMESLASLASLEVRGAIRRLASYLALGLAD